MEKTQTKPTVAMIESLFQTEAPTKETFDFRKEISLEEKKEVRFQRKAETTTQ